MSCCKSIVHSYFVALSKACLVLLSLYNACFVLVFNVPGCTSLKRNLKKGLGGAMLSIRIVFLFHTICQFALTVNLFKYIIAKFLLQPISGYCPSPSHSQFVELRTQKAVHCWPDRALIWFLFYFYLFIIYFLISWQSPNWRRLVSSGSCLAEMALATTLCLAEKLRIITPNKSEIINKRIYLVSKCRHVNKFRLADFTGVT